MGWIKRRLQAQAKSNIAREKLYEKDTSGPLLLPPQHTTPLSPIFPYKKNFFSFEKKKVIILRVTEQISETRARVIERKESCEDNDNEKKNLFCDFDVNVDAKTRKISA